MPSVWIEALKQFNMDGTSWCVPRKNTEDYHKVRVMEGLRGGKDAKQKAKTHMKHYEQAMKEKAKNAPASKMTYPKTEANQAMYELKGRVELADFRRKNPELPPKVKTTKQKAEKKPVVEGVMKQTKENKLKVRYA
jgi:hypothetical protein